jgi:hypothetical protein
MSSQSFHNTVPLNSVEVRRRELSAQSQEEIILQWFKRRHGLEFSPDEVFVALVYAGVCGLKTQLHRDTPITSVRRAITNLEKKGMLRKTEIRRPTPRGATSRTWTWQEPVEPGQGKLF